MKSKLRKNKPDTTKAVIYARFSSHGQREQSIEGQLLDCHAYAKREGIVVVDEYVDRAKTGRLDDRPAFQRMIKDAAKGQFQVVLVWMLDRFARNRYDSAIYKQKLRKHGVRVVSVKENISEGPEGIILEGVLESVAEYYSANLSSNIRRGQRENVSGGLHCGGRTPYGFKSVGVRLVPDERTAPFIREVFERYAAGTPKTEIVRWLNAAGARTTTGKPFTISSFSRALSNTTYIGRLMRNGEIIEGAAEPLIDEAVFSKVQERIKINARAPAASKAKVDYLLQGKAFCGHCGNTMIGDSGYGKLGTVYNYYTCSARKRRHACKKKSEKKDLLEVYIVAQTVQYVLSPDMVSSVAAAVVHQYEKEFSSSSVAELERLLSRLDQDMRNLVETLTEAPKAARPMIYEKMEAIEAQKADLEIDLAKLRIASSIRYTQDEIIAILRKICTGDPTDPAYRRRVIDTFINSVYTYDERVVVFYNIRGGKQVPYESLTAAMPQEPIGAPDNPPSPPDDPPDPNPPAPRKPKRRSSSSSSQPPIHAPSTQPASTSGCSDMNPSAPPNQSDANHWKALLYMICGKFVLDIQFLEEDLL